MDTDRSKSENDRLRSTNFYLKIILVIVAGIGLSEGIAITRLIGSERIIVTPPGFDRAFWVSGERVSKEYLERWGYYVTKIGLDVNPRNVEWACATILDMSTRDAGPKIKEDCDKTIEKIKKDGIRTTFDPNGDMRIDMEQMRISVPGVLSTYVGDRHTSDRAALIAIWFNLDQRGRMKLDFYKEVPANDPFGVKLAGARAPGGN